MPAYFLDASALAKRYVAEPGLRWVRALFDPSLGNVVAISQASTVETVSAFCRKVWTTQGAISVADRDRLIALFRQDLRRDYSIVPVTQDAYNSADDLCAKHNTDSRWIVGVPNRALALVACAGTSVPRAQTTPTEIEAI
jgi:hypothetical protein